jgi:feruloyl esterase
MRSVVVFFLLSLLVHQVSAKSQLHVWSSNGALEAQNPNLRCRALSSYTGIEHTTIVNATYYPGPAPVEGVPQSQCTVESPLSNITVALCRVLFVVNTTEASQIKAEAWLPDEWYGRFLAVGNGGLSGCVDYAALTYGSSFHFATVSGNNGHNGGFSNGEPFYKNPEVLNDFTTRGIHTISVVGKEIVEQYYSRPSDKAYYLGCSGGGRQGAYAALHFPNDFDGIIAGATGTDWNNLIGAVAMLSKYVGAPNGTSSPSFITEEQWGLVHQEVLRQCDALDGVEDQIITEPDDCDFHPESLLCPSGSRNKTECLNAPQVEALKNIYSPIYGLEGQLVYPGYQPGAESTYTPDLFGGEIVGYSVGWFRYVVYDEPTYDFKDFGLKDIAAAVEQDPGQVSTFDGHFEVFREHGGKYLTYYGTHDNLVPPHNSKRMYDLVSKALSTPNLDDFYRLFAIPGMGHCTGGQGAYQLGQSNLAIPPTDKNDTAHNMLLAMVDWVEGSQAPDSFVGTGDSGQERVVCRYPVEHNVWDGEKYVCR